MTKSQIVIPNNSKSPFTLSQSWKWEKRHWLAIISLVCLALWWLAPSLKDMPWLQSVISYLPVIGSLAFAADNLLKLTR